MGRFTKASRDGFQGNLTILRTDYKEALKDKDRKEAFDKLVDAWCSEQGALTYAESLNTMEYILFTSVVDNRRLLDDIKNRLK
ncbi:hypothetical protein JW865_06665 [Candidatus Bathyarchaeota archaeon]|nr:hypothetical protein [Candidatus Bathyarchaeota archaeon]